MRDMDAIELTEAATGERILWWSQMSRRITTADVRITRRDPQPTGGLIIQADVRGVNRGYVVDYNPAWSAAWLCSCGRAIDGTQCAHIRVTREVVGQ